MESSREKRVRSSVLPSPVFAVGIGIGALLMIPGSIVGGIVVFLNAGWLIILLIAGIWDAILTREFLKVSVERDAPDSVSVGHSAPVRVLLHNPCRQLVRLTVRDFPEQKLRPEGQEAQVDLTPGTRSVLTYTITPLKRGKYELGPAAIRARSLLGLIVRSWLVDTTETIEVLPDVVVTREHEILAKQNRLNMMGLQASRLKGQGQEFSSLREWLPDDGLRNVDWKATARRGHLIAREYEFERSQNIMLVLDLGRTMASRVSEAPGDEPVSKADFAINASVLMSWVANKANDRVGLAAFSSSMETLILPGKGTGHFNRILTALTPMEASPEEADYRSAFLRLAQTIRKRSLFIIFTDLLDPVSSEVLIAELQHLIPRHLVLVVALADYELKTMLRTPPQEVFNMYQQTVAYSVMDDRRKALAQLETRGILTVDASPADLTVATVNRYLEIKRTGRI